jgi:hypothetical protein
MTKGKKMQAKLINHPLGYRTATPSQSTLYKRAARERARFGLPKRSPGKPRLENPCAATLRQRQYRARKATEMARGESLAGKRSRPATKSLNADRPLAGPPRVSERHEAEMSTSKAVTEPVDGQSASVEAPASAKRRKRKSRARDWSYRPLHRRMYTTEEIEAIMRLLPALGERAKKRRKVHLVVFREIRERNVEGYVAGIQGKIVRDTGFEPPHISLAHYYSHVLGRPDPKTPYRFPEPVEILNFDGKECFPPVQWTPGGRNNEHDPGKTKRGRREAIYQYRCSIGLPPRTKLGVRNPALASDPRTIRRWAREDHKRLGVSLPPRRKAGRKFINNPSKSALSQRRYRERMRLGHWPLPRGAKPRPDPSQRLIKARLYRAIKKAEQALKEKERWDASSRPPVRGANRLSGL